MLDGGRLQSFFAIMKKSEENTHAGFKLLEAREDAISYFDYVVDQGFFEDNSFSPPRRVENDQESYSIPPHPGLGFLEKVTKQAVERDNDATAKSIVGIIKRISSIKPNGSGQLDNFYVWRSFLQITTTLPIKFYDDHLIDLVKIWLSSKFDNSIVSSELPPLVLKLLKSANADCYKWACTILDFSTDFSLNTLAVADHQVVTLRGNIDSYWLNDIVFKTADLYGSEIGLPAIQIMLTKLELVQQSGRLKPSSWYRSAIENHPQNIRNDDHENILINATREILLSWYKSKTPDSDQHYLKLINSENTLFQRLALFLATELPPNFDSVVVGRISHFMSNPEFHHETYRFLEVRFRELGRKSQASILSAIRALKTQPNEKSDRHLIREKLTWLTSICGKGYSPADREKERLELKQPDVMPTKHPDFLSYYESSIGPGPSPISLPEIFGRANKRTLIEYLNNYQPGPFIGLDTPTIGGLSALFRQAVKEQPDLFIRHISDYLDAKPAYQYELIAAFHDLMREPGYPKDSPTWQNYWPQLLAFSFQIVTTKGFWNEPSADSDEYDDDQFGARRSWIPGQIADLLSSGLNNDKSPIPSTAMKLVEQLILNLLKNAPIEDRDLEDQLSHAINSIKGRAFEAFIALVLNSARNSGEAKKAKVWKKYRAVFESELESCRNKNLDVSALFGQYLAHFIFLSEEWVEKSIARILPHKLYHLSFRAAISGLAFCNGSQRKVYDLLYKSNSVEAAIKSDDIKGSSIEQIFQRLALGILWGIESANGAALSLAKQKNMAAEIASMVSFLGRVSIPALSSEEKARVIGLWIDLDSWAANDLDRRGLRNMLIVLLRFADDLNDIILALATRGIHNIDSYHQTISAVRELNRLFEVAPSRAVELLSLTVQTNQFVYDHEGQLKTLLRKMFKDFPKQTIASIVQLRSLKGMEELELELRGSIPG